MGIYTESILEINQRYVVQDVSKFPKEKGYMIGQPCLLKQIVGSIAHVSFTGRMTEIPVRSLIKVKGYTAKSVRSENADGFVVIHQNNLEIKVGTSYLNVKDITKTHLIMIVEGKEIRVPLAICCPLVKDSKTEKQINTSKVTKETGIPENVVEDAIEYIAPVSNRKDITELPSSLLKLLPNVNIQDIKDELEATEGVFFDYEGNDHLTVALADKANTKIRHKRLTKKLIDLATKFLSKLSLTIRENH